jgi:hypothetical protein
MNPRPGPFISGPFIPGPFIPGPGSAQNAN